jgi:L-rhamnose-H+ transport protein
LGVAIITRAGVVRDGTRKGSKFGIILAILSGLGSGAQNVGFSSAGAQNIAEAFIERGYTNISVSSGRWLPVLAGGCIMGALICMAEAIRKRNVHTMIEKGALKRSVILFGVSIVWFVALIFYGLATNMLGHLGETAGWILFNSLALVISGVLGFATGEWKNNKNARKWLFAGNGTLIVAWIFFALI